LVDESSEVYDEGIGWAESGEGGLTTGADDVDDSEGDDVEMCAFEESELFSSMNCFVVIISTLLYQYSNTSIFSLKFFFSG